MKKTNELMKMLFIAFVTITALAACNDEDEMDFQLALSKPSCEVMEGQSITVGLSAHENTTINITDPALIDAIYRWKESETAIIEIKAKQKGETSIRVTDHETGETATLAVTVTEFPLPQLGARQTGGNIFDMMEFYLYNKNDYSLSIDFNELAAVCDSIVWTVKGVEGSYKVFKYEKGDNYTNQEFIEEWSHCFMLPGEYETLLTTYKDGKAISSSKQNQTITNKKDFLAYNWSEITHTSQAWADFANVLNRDNIWSTYKFNNGIPSVHLISPKGDAYHMLYGYLCKLYDQPTYNDKEHKLWRLYDQLFSENKISGNPCAIWVTERAHIILLLADEDYDWQRYKVYAEPAK